MPRRIRDSAVGKPLTGEPGTGPDSGLCMKLDAQARNGTQGLAARPARMLNGGVSAQERSH